jgi:hypothetical protein
VKSDEDRKALELFYLQQDGRPVLSPAVPADRLGVLRTAFMAMANISTTPPEIVERLAKVVTPPG